MYPALCIKNLLFYVLILFCATTGYASDPQDEPPQNIQRTYFEDALDYRFSDPSLLQKACSPRTFEFERLEFLGDRIVGFSIAHLLYLQNPSAKVHQHAKVFEQLVSKEILAKIYEHLNIPVRLIASDSYLPPLNGSISKKTASDVIEALLGAIYKDNGMDAAQECVRKLFSQFFDFTEEKKPVFFRQSSRQNNSFEELTFLQQNISYYFKNIFLLQSAFVHSSAGGGYFKGLAFLGNRVLAVIIAENIFDLNPTDNEGDMTKAFIDRINVQAIQEVFQTWQLGRYLVRNEGGLSNLLKSTHASPRIAAHTLQALLGAVYLDDNWLFNNWLVARVVAQRLLFSVPPQTIRPSKIERLKARLKESTLEKKVSTL